MIQKIEGLIFNLYILPPNTKEIPEDIINNETTCFVLQGDNLFKFRKTDIYTILSGVDDKEKILKEFFPDKQNFNTKTLYAVEGTLTDGILNYFFPLEEFAYAISYFEWVYDTYKNESAVLLLVNHELKEWKVLTVVNTETSGVSVKYIHPTSNVELTDPEEQEAHKKVVEKYTRLFDEGWRIYGTIHSHCNFSAFHSSVDDADENDFEGLHITIGNLKSGYSYSSRFMLEQVPLKLEITDILNIDDTKEVEALSKTLEISDEDKSLFFRRKFVSTYTSGKAKKLYQPTGNHKPYIYDIDADDYDDSYSYFSKFYSPQKGDAAKYYDNVFDENEITCLQHEKNNEIIYVKTDFYKEHEDTFFKDHMILFWSSDESCGKETEEDDKLFIFEEDGRCESIREWR